MIQPKEAAVVLTDTILNDKRHVHYPRVNMLSDMYRRFVTGIGLENDLEHIVSRESEAQLKFRKKLFYPIVPAICHRADVPFTKVHRAQGVIESITFSGEASAKQEKALKKAIDEFWGDEDLSDYFADRFRELNRVDPNAYIMVEFDAFDNTKEKARPYPLEISSRQAINWSKVNNKVDWMIAEFPHQYSDGNGHMLDGQRFVMYFGDVLDFRQIHNDDRAAETFNASSKKVQRIKIGPKFFECVLRTPFTADQEKRFQGVQPGHMKDPATDGQTFLSYLHSARNRMMETLKSGSEHTLVTALMVHPKVYMYLPTCEGYKDAEDKQHVCVNGKDGHTGQSCKRCGGTGKYIPTSVLDVMVLDMPETGEANDRVKLSEMMHIYSPDVAIATALREVLRDLEDQSVRDIFTSLQHQRGKVTATATEINVDSEAMNDALHPYARKVSTARTLLVEVTAAFVDSDKGLVYTHKFPEDFRLAPMGVLLDDLIKAKGQDPELVALLTEDAIAKKLRDRPLELRMYEVKKQFRPLASLSVEDRRAVMAAGDVAESDATLLRYESEVYRELGKDPQFWYREMDAQKKLIDDQVKIIMDRVKAEKVVEVDFENKVNPDPEVIPA